MAVENQSPATEAQAPTTSSRNSVLRPILLIVLLAAACVGAIFYLNRPTTPKGVIEVSGRIEGYETNVGAKIGGRVDTVSHREGELVRAGELIAQISDDDVQAQLRGAEARIEKAKAQVESIKDKLLVIQSNIDEGEFKVNQSKEDSLGRISQWESTVASDEAKLAQARAELIQAQADLGLSKTRKERYEFLVGKEAVTRDEYDQIVNTFETTKALVDARKANVNAVEKELRSAKGQLDSARSSRFMPRIESAAKSANEKQLLQVEDELEQSQQEVKNATADRDATKANVAYLKILSPIDGVVTARAVEPGAVVVPGQVILSIINLNTVYLRAYVPEGEVGKIRVGQSAKVFLDAHPDKPMDGKIIQIDPEGSFTPENIYFKNDRVKQVFGIKIGIEQPGGFAKPGMPADAQIKLEQ